MTRLVTHHSSITGIQFSVWRNLVAHVLREHGAGGSNPPTLTVIEVMHHNRAGGRAAMHPAVTRAAQRANGGSIPSLRMGDDDDAPEVPMAERRSPKPEATGSIPVRRADDDVAERQGAELQPPLTQVRFLPSSLCFRDGGCSSTG